jgi:NTP pyrophosphatase (non-canonical NTP hydrolase)
MKGNNMHELFTEVLMIELDDRGLLNGIDDDIVDEIKESISEILTSKFSAPKNFFETLEDKNKERQIEWAGSEKADMLFHAVELGEETGEVLGAVKKLYRSLNGIKGNGHNKEKYIENLKEEIGDVIIVLSLLTIAVEKEGIDISIEESAINKFNLTSEKHGMKTKM